MKCTLSALIASVNIFATPTLLGSSLSACSNFGAFAPPLTEDVVEEVEAAETATQTE